MNNSEKVGTHKRITTSFVVKVGILAGIAFVLTYLKLPPTPFFPPFLDFELSDIPAVVGALVLGPAAGVAIEGIKNLIGVILKPVGAGVGQFANFIISSSYILVLCWIYNRKKTILGFVIGSIFATIAMAIAAGLLNYFLLIPVFVKIMSGLTIESLVAMTAKVNPLVNNFEKLIILSVLPFNIIKGLVVSLVGYFLVRILRPAFRYLK